jgi:hypothetical protein
LYLRAAEVLRRPGRLGQPVQICEQLLAWRPSRAAGWQLAFELHRQVGDVPAFLSAARQRATLQRAQAKGAVAEGLLGLALALASAAVQRALQSAPVLFEPLLKLAPHSAAALAPGTPTAWDSASWGWPKGGVRAWPTCDPPMPRPRPCARKF